jgi:tRNA 2-thiouridine synthesizing protein A
MKEVIDTSALGYPDCILQIATKALHMEPGQILEVSCDCPTFERDVRAWCHDRGRTFLSVEHERGNKQRIQIQL